MMIMNKTIQLRLWAFLLTASVAIGAMAQGSVRINKAVRLQQVNGKSVLRATDSRLPQTLAYFDHEEDVTSLPPEVYSFLAFYEEALRRIDAGAAPEEVLSLDATATNATVGPLLGDIEFDQGTPYNDKCPYLNGGRAVTGCVATAMAQIMTYYRYPSVGTGTANYTGSSGETTYKFAEHPFDWDHILHTYKNGGYTTVQANAIAELMLACGASVKMNYNYAGSGADSEKVTPALRDYFGYDPSIYSRQPELSESKQYTIWTATLKREFEAGRPVYYSGGTQTDGHAFVLDGYMEEDGVVYFHVNWGWNGKYNGYFLLTGLKPDEGAGYSYRNHVVCNIFPKGAGVENIKEGEFRLDMNAPVYTILGTKIPAADMQHGFIYIQSGHKFVY